MDEGSFRVSDEDTEIDVVEVTIGLAVVVAVSSSVVVAGAGAGVVVVAVVVVTVTSEDGVWSSPEVLSGDVVMSLVRSTGEDSSLWARAEVDVRVTQSAATGMSFAQEDMPFAYCVFLKFLRLTITNPNQIDPQPYCIIFITKTLNETGPSSAPPSLQRQPRHNMMCDYDGNEADFPLISDFPAHFYDY